MATNVKRWKATRVLIIDEVSMLSAELFDKLDYIARAIRKQPEPFGGIQVSGNECNCRASGIGDYYIKETNKI